MECTSNKNAHLGKLYGIGIGPGDPGFLTLKALKTLENSDLMLIPKATPDKKSLAYQIAKEAFKEYSSIENMPPTEDVIFPMERGKEKLIPYWEKALNLVLKKLNDNKKISLITLGDPTLYSTYCYLLEQINNEYPHYPVETIPGIYSFSAISSRLNLPLTIGEEKMIIIPVEKNCDYKKELLIYDTIVFMKVSSDFEGLLTQLIETKRIKEALIISRLGQKQESISKNLENLKGKKIDYFSTIIVNPRIPQVGDKDEDTKN